VIISKKNDCFWAIIKPKKRQTKDKTFPAPRQCFMALREQCGEHDIQTPI
jgi:hypothetical protein